MIDGWNGAGLYHGCAVPASSNRMRFRRPGRVAALAAVAIETTVLRADPAGRFQELAQPPPGTMKLHGQRIRGDATLACNLRGLRATEIDAPDQSAYCSGNSGISLSKQAQSTFSSSVSGVESGSDL